MLCSEMKMKTFGFVFSFSGLLEARQMTDIKDVIQ